MAAEGGMMLRGNVVRRTVLGASVPILSRSTKALLDSTRVM